MDPPIRRIAIATGGGDAPGLNAVIRAVVLAAARLGWECHGIRDGFNGLLAPDRCVEAPVVPLTAAAVHGIGHLGGTILGSTNRGDPLRFPVACADGGLAEQDRSDELVALCRGAGFDAAALRAAGDAPPEPMLTIQVNDAERRRHDREEHPAALEECLAWLRALAPTEGNFLVFAGRSGGVVQMRWQAPPGQEEPRLWLETPEPDLGRSRGRHVTRDEAAEMITILARTGRVAVDDLGVLEDVRWES